MQQKIVQCQRCELETWVDEEASKTPWHCSYCLEFFAVGKEVKRLRKILQEFAYEEVGEQVGRDELIAKIGSLEEQNRELQFAVDRMHEKLYCYTCGDELQLMHVHCKHCYEQWKNEQKDKAVSFKKHRENKIKDSLIAQLKKNGYTE